MGNRGNHDSDKKEGQRFKEVCLGRIGSGPIAGLLGAPFPRRAVVVAAISSLGYTGSNIRQQPHDQHASKGNCHLATFHRGIVCSIPKICFGFPLGSANAGFLAIQQIVDIAAMSPNQQRANDGE